MQVLNNICCLKVEIKYFSYKLLEEAALVNMDEQNIIK